MAASKGFWPVPSKELRVELLSIYGIGPETADDIIVYAAGKPSFVIDAYTRRIVQRLGIAPDSMANSYSGYQALFQDHLPADAALFNEYHALLDRHAKDTCAKVPRCDGCCLRQVCVTGQNGGRCRKYSEVSRNRRKHNAGSPDIHWV